MIVGVDLGSAHIGLAALDPASRAVVGDGDTIDVDPADISRAVDDLVGRLALCVPAERVVVEHAPWFPRGGASSAGLVASQRAWTVCHDILTAFRARCPIPVDTIARQTWAHRVVPHTRGGITDAMITAALPALLGASAAKLHDVHQRDAAGAALGWLLAPEPKPVREPRPRAPRPAKRRPSSKNDAWIARRSAARLAAREAIGCTCPPGHIGRHPRTCPAHRPKHA